MDVEETLLEDIEFLDGGSSFLSIVITLQIISFSILGVIGNVIICIAIPRNQHMRTASNVYLFALAAQDLIILLSVLVAHIIYWYVIVIDFHCVVQWISEEVYSYSHSLMTIAFTTERYIAFCHPLLSRRVSSLSLAVKIILSSWVVALLFAVPQVLKPEHLHMHHNDTHLRELTHCVRVFDQFDQPHFEILPMSLFLIAMIIAIGLTINTGMNLRRSLAETYNPRSQTQSYRIIVAFLVLFCLRWTSFYIRKFSNDLILTLGMGMLEHATYWVGPILWFIISNEFKDAIMTTLSKLWCKSEDRPFRTGSIQPITLGNINISESNESIDETPSQPSRWNRVA